jgi:Regulator of chromosome condensation (RCC1) repeat/Bacterial Ig-like domain (group 2)
MKNYSCGFYFSAMPNALLVVFTTILLGACDDKSGPNLSGIDSRQINSVKIEPQADTVLIADTIRLSDRKQLRAIARNDAGAVMPVKRFVWQTSDTTVAVIDSLGILTPRKIGQVQISASAARVGSATIVILPAEQRLTVSPSADTIFVDDPVVSLRDTSRLRATALDTGSHPLTGVRFHWQSSSADIATVDSTGRVSAVAPGKATISVRSSNAQANTVVEVAPVVRNVMVTTTNLEVLDGDTLQLVAKGFDYAGRPNTRRFAWRSSAPPVASVDSNGRVAFASRGTATIVATTAFRSDSVTIVSLPRQLTAIEVGADYACGVAPLGRLFCWGKGTTGQLGSGADSTCFSDSTATRIPCTLAPKRAAQGSIAFTAVAAGDSTACAISDVQQLYCWGDDSFGQIGNGAGGGGAQPRLATVASERFNAITSGGAHACALNLTGLAYCWGQDSLGQLGDLRRINSTSPIPVVGPNGQVAQALSYARISAGGKHTCAIATDGAAWCWGDGSSGALGTGSSIPSSDTPVAVAGARTYLRIASGRNHTCAIAGTGELFCWGGNSSGQLGVTATGIQNTPLLVSSSYADVSVGDDFTCALSAAGAVNCWGRNSAGQLGRGEASPSGTSSAIVTVAGGHQFVAISSGRRHACAIDTAGDVWCWGSNTFGSLGNGLQAAVRSTPEKLARLR